MQLKLAALEAKLKLKKLQQKKIKPVASDSNVGIDGYPEKRRPGDDVALPTPQRRNSYENASKLHPKSAAGVQIPLSPLRKHYAAEEARSPGRVLLGIDKGLKGKNVSLRRPQNTQSKDDDPFRVLQHSDSVSRKFGLPRDSNASQLDQPIKQKSFSEKIAETRRQDKEQKDRVSRLRRQRSTGFGIQQQDLDTFRGVSEKSAEETLHQPKIGNGEFSRDQILKAVYQPNSGLGPRSDSGAGIRRSRAQGIPSSDIWRNPYASPELQKPTKSASNDSKKHTRSRSPTNKATAPPLRDLEPETSKSLFEPFSSLHLSKRLLPHDFLTRTLSGKHVFSLPSLLGSVKSPDYLLPDIPESDHVVLAIVASKSNPLTHKDTHKATPSDTTTSTSEAAQSEQNSRGKYMVLTLTDLKWTVDLFLFATGYTRFWKLTPGTVVALLNPDIMPPPPGKSDTGRFSLKLSSSDDTVLEIGTSRDLGWCKSVRKDGKQCGSWIDKRHTEFCEFHVDAVVERTRRGRMEVQGMSAPFAPGGRREGRTGHFGGKRRGDQRGKEDGLLSEGAQYDRGNGTRYFVTPSIPGRSAAQLIDAEGVIERGGSKEDRVRKRLVEREKEKEIARKLGEGGNGAGSEYLRFKHGGGDGDISSKDTHPESRISEPVDAISLGLMGNRATNVHLSPIKKRKRMGSVLDGGVGDEAPRKKTRFVTERGIKEAGRESFGMEIGGKREDDDEDDDGLDVV